MKQANKRKILAKKLSPKPQLRGERGKLNRAAEKSFFKSKSSK